MRTDFLYNVNRNEELLIMEEKEILEKVEEGQKKNLLQRIDWKKIWKYICEIDLYCLLAPFCMLAVLYVFCAFTGLWPEEDNIYNSFALQADSWLKGSLSLINGENYSYLELAIFNGQYYVSFPPFPSYVLLPFSLVYGINTPDGKITVVFVLIGALYAYKLCRELLGNERKEIAFLISMMIYIGSNTLFFSVISWVWFMAQSMSFTLTILALYFAVKAKPGRSLFFWACAVGCRPFQILMFPVMIMLMIRTWTATETDFKLWNKIKEQWYKGIPCFVVAISYCILNYVRFGSIMEFGHNYLPEFTREEAGQFNIVYLEENIKRMFRLPEMPANEAFNFFNSDGIALWIVNPIMILIVITAIYKLIKSRDRDTAIVLVILGTVIIHLFVICMHRTLGGWHFGNRYTCDLLPMVAAGICLSMPISDKFLVGPKLLFIYGFAINMIGTVAAYNYWI